MDKRFLINHKNNWKQSIRTLFWCLLIITTSLFSVVFAQENKKEKERNFELFLGGGFLSVNGGNPKKPTTDSEEITTSIQKGDPYAFTLTFMSSYMFALEISFGMFTNNYVVDLYDWDPVNEKWDYHTREETTEILLFHLNGVYNIIQGPVKPYLTAGIGWVAFVDKAVLSPNAGFGVKLFPTKFLGFRIDLRMFLTHLRDTVDWEIISNRYYKGSVGYSDDLTFKQAILGIILRF